MNPAIEGFATPAATRAYAAVHGAHAGEGHYSDFLRTRIRLSSLGVGTFPGAASPDVDASVGVLVSSALRAGINVIDTAAHYRYGRALAAVGAGLRDAILRGVPREAVFVVSKGGFLTFRGGWPKDWDAWFETEIEDQGLGSRADTADRAHLLSPAYINYQIELSRSLIGVDTLDAFLVDQPEVHIRRLGKEPTNRLLLGVFEVLERAVRENRIRCYGISTFYGFRVETDHPLFQSLTSMLGLAEKAAAEAEGKPSGRHHFKIVQMPFNQVMLEGFTRFNQATGQGNVASTLQGAHQLHVYTMASHGMLKGKLAEQSADSIAEGFPELSPARRAIQFNRSTPGLGTSLFGLSRAEHLEDLIAVMDTHPMKRERFLAMFRRAED